MVVETLMINSRYVIFNFFAKHLLIQSQNSDFSYNIAAPRMPHLPPICYPSKWFTPSDCMLSIVEVLLPQLFQPAEIYVGSGAVVN